MTQNTDPAISPGKAASLLACLMLALLLSGCGQGAGSGAPAGQDISISQAGSLELAQTNGAPLRVVASTSIIADVAASLGGDHVSLTTLIPRQSDPHAYQPTPGDLQALYQADLILLNGFDLEAELENVLAPVSQQVPVISLSEGLTARSLVVEAGESEHSGGLDPHVWFDPAYVAGWVDRIELALSRLDPGNTEFYGKNAERYRSELSTLDAWIEEQAGAIPPVRRKLVLDHLVLGYFAERYGFEIISALVPAFSSAAEPSPRELAALSEAIDAEGIPAIFIGVNTNPLLARGIASDLGVEVVELYTGSLGPAGGDADTYLKMMQYNVLAIARALNP